MVIMSNYVERILDEDFGGCDRCSGSGKFPKSVKTG